MARVRKIKQVKVEELRLLNFRSFENARLPLSANLTTIIGHNGSGKTTLLDAFDFVREALSVGLQVAIDKRGGVYSLGRRKSNGEPESLAVAIKLCLDGQPVVYGFSITPGIRNRRGSSIEREFLTTHDGKHSYWLDKDGLHTGPAVKLPAALANEGGQRTNLLLTRFFDAYPLWREVYQSLRGIHSYSFSPSVIRQGRQVSNYDYLERDGSNAADILYSLQEQFNYETSKLREELQELENERVGLRLRLDEHDISESEYDAREEAIQPRKDEIISTVATIRASHTIGRIEAALRQITPDITEISSRQEAGRNVLYFKQQAVSERGSKYANEFSGFEMSDGTLRSLAVMLALYQQPTPTAVLIDEMEDSIHPLALDVLVGNAYASTERQQVAITSHSPELLSYPVIKGEDVRLVEWWQGGSWVYPLSDMVLAVLDKHNPVGNMLNHNALDTTDQPYVVDKKKFFDVEAALLEESDMEEAEEVEAIAALH